MNSSLKINIQEINLKEEIGRRKTTVFDDDCDDDDCDDDDDDEMNGPNCQKRIDIFSFYLIREINETKMTKNQKLEEGCGS